MIKKGNSIKTHFCDLFFVFLYMRKQLPGKKIQAFVFDMVASSKFEISITIIIALNMVLNAVEYFNEGLEYENIVNVVNTIFVTLYGLESLFKIIYRYLS